MKKCLNIAFFLILACTLEAKVAKQPLPNQPLFSVLDYSDKIFLSNSFSKNIDKIHQKPISLKDKFKKKFKIKRPNPNGFERQAVSGFVWIVAGSYLLPFVSAIIGITRCTKALKRISINGKRGRKLAIAGIIIGVFYITAILAIIAMLPII